MTAIFVTRCLSVVYCCYHCSLLVALPVRVRLAPCWFLTSPPPPHWSCTAVSNKTTIFTPLCLMFSFSTHLPDLSLHTIIRLQSTSSSVPFLSHSPHTCFLCQPFYFQSWVDTMYFDSIIELGQNMVKMWSFISTRLSGLTEKCSLIYLP